MLRRADTSHEPARSLPPGSRPSASPRTPPAPTSARPRTREAAPFFVSMSSSADDRSPNATENPLVSTDARSITAEGTRLSPPPAPPGHAKWLAVGSSNPSSLTAVSIAPPPRTMRSLRLSCEAATPGRCCITRRRSSRPPTADAICGPDNSARPSDAGGGTAGGADGAPRTSVVIPRPYSISTCASTSGSTTTCTGADGANPSRVATIACRPAGRSGNSNPPSGPVVVSARPSSRRTWTPPMPARVLPSMTRPMMREGGAGRSESGADGASGLPAINDTAVTRQAMPYSMASYQAGSGRLLSRRAVAE